MSASGPLAFLDTNVLVYAFENNRSPRNSTARRLVEELIAQNRLCLSTQVLQELFVTLTRKVRQPCSVDEALECLDTLAVWPIFVTDYPCIRDAATLARDAKLGFWDALIILAAARCGAVTVYTEDLNHGQEILGVRIENPFA
jgi:predicted nucleic acid-binding protein